MNTTDYLQKLGYLGFTMRLKRISDQLMHDGRKLYQELDFDIEPNWYGVFLLLEKEERLSVTEIADCLDLSHPSAISIINKMIKKEYLITEQSQQDKRMRMLTLSKKAKTKLPTYKKLWNAGTICASELLNGTQLLADLSILEQHFKEKGFKDRTLSALHDVSELNHSLNIVPFAEKYEEDFKRLNYEWLHMYFRVEAHDIEMLEDPQGYIIDKGGEIFFAIIDGVVAGTVAMINAGTEGFELSKMAVSPMYQGKKIGKRLMMHALEFAQHSSKNRVFLESNKKLTPALQLYKSMGFKTIDLDPNTPYERADIKMELIF